MKKELANRILSSIILIPITFFFIIKGSYFFNFFILICFCIIAYEWHMMSKKKKYSFYGFIFLIISAYTIYKLRSETDMGLFWFLLIMIVCVSTDIGGYFFGKLLKGPKLIKISPKKTYSGMIGGFLLSLISVSVFMGYLVSEEFSLSLFAFVITISAISQIGDIVISYFKRMAKIKDTGKIIPGHGGLLDRADGMIFAFPFSYFTISLNLVF